MLLIDKNRLKKLIFLLSFLHNIIIFDKIIMYVILEEF